MIKLVSFFIQIVRSICEYVRVGATGRGGGAIEWSNGFNVLVFGLPFTLTCCVRAIVRLFE